MASLGGYRHVVGRPWRCHPSHTGRALGTDLGFVFRRAAEYVHRIIHGARPSDLPVERPAKFRLSVNLDTAKALGLAVPPSILARADEVIE